MCRRGFSTAFATCDDNVWHRAAWRPFLGVKSHQQKRRWHQPAPSFQVLFRCLVRLLLRGDTRGNVTHHDWSLSAAPRAVLVAERVLSACRTDWPSRCAGGRPGSDKPRSKHRRSIGPSHFPLVASTERRPSATTINQPLQRHVGSRPGANFYLPLITIVCRRVRGSSS